MFRTVRISTFANTAGGRASAAFRAMQAQPAWITRFALLTMFIIIALPILLLVLLAIVASVVVFGTLAIVNILLRKIRSIIPQHDGRENVRVIQRANQSL
jgi:amino acid transporter